jgi:DAK2 domain fusion protein YloV
VAAEQTLTIAVLRRWASSALHALGAARAEIDDLNVYPVPDGDTGTNMYLTWEAACRALPEGEVSFADTVAAFSHGALLGARGNSGVITSQLVRAAGARLAQSDAPDAKDLAAALTAAADAAYGALAKPVEGTMLTVARAAAVAAEEAAKEGGRLTEVWFAAAAGARAALERTTEQLEALRRAGVVDAGGAGLVVMLEAMDAVMQGPRLGTRSSALPPRVPAGPPGSDLDPDGPAYEVMYLLDAPDDLVGGFRDTLDRLGDSVVVVGGDTLWNVHVHTDEVGAAIEAGIAIGRPHRIRVTHFADLTPPEKPSGRAVIAVAAGAGLAELFRSAGAQVVRGGPGRRCSTGELLDAIEASGAAEVVLLPNDSDTILVAEAAATAARQTGVRIAVIPTRAQVQGLAAIAVHDASRSFDDDVVHQSAAAGQTRQGAVTIAVKDAWTMAGQCHVGDALGVVDGDFALITEDLQQAAVGVVDRLLAGGGELMTVVCGRQASALLVDTVVRHVRRRRPDVEVCVYDGDQERYPLLIGVE